MNNRLNIKHLLFFVVANILFIFFIMNFVSNENKVQLRFALFSKKITRKQFEERKNILIINKDDSSNSDIWLKYKCNTYDTLSFILSQFKNFQSSHKCGVYSSNLFFNVKNATSGYGCCSDYSQSFIALSNLNKYPVCEVSNLNHTFNEIYDHKRKIFIWIDLMNKHIAKDSLGNILSVLEIYDNFKHNNKIQIFSFEGKNNIFDAIRVKTPFFFSKESYQSIILTNYKNVFEIDRKFNYCNFLSKDFINLFFSITNNPNYLVFDELNIFWNKILTTRKYLLFFSILYILLNTLFFFKFCIKRGH